MYEEQINKQDDSEVSHTQSSLVLYQSIDSVVSDESSDSLEVASPTPSRCVAITNNMNLEVVSENSVELF